MIEAKRLNQTLIEELGARTIKKSRRVKCTHFIMVHGMDPTQLIQSVLMDTVKQNASQLR